MHLKLNFIRFKYDPILDKYSIEVSIENLIDRKKHLLKMYINKNERFNLKNPNGFNEKKNLYLTNSFILYFQRCHDNRKYNLKKNFIIIHFAYLLINIFFID